MNLKLHLGVNMGVKERYWVLKPRYLGIPEGSGYMTGKADSWERGVIPHRAGSITRRIGKHVFYVMAGL